MWLVALLLPLGTGFIDQLPLLHDRVQLVLVIERLAQLLPQLDLKK